MNNYHTNVLKDADIFTVMGSIYAEVARYDSALRGGQLASASHAAKRAVELIQASKDFTQLNDAQKREIKQCGQIFMSRADQSSQSGLDTYLLPFALAARLHR